MVEMAWREERLEPKRGQMRNFGSNPGMSG